MLGADCHRSFVDLDANEVVNAMRAYSHGLESPLLQGELINVFGTCERTAEEAIEEGLAGIEEPAKTKHFFVGQRPQSFRQGDQFLVGRVATATRLGIAVSVVRITGQKESARARCFQAKGELDRGYEGSSRFAELGDFFPLLSDMDLDDILSDHEADQ